MSEHFKSWEAAADWASTEPVPLEAGAAAAPAHDAGRAGMSPLLDEPLRLFDTSPLAAPAAVDAPSAGAGQAPAEPPRVIRLAVKGLERAELPLLNGAVLVSRRRNLRLELLPDSRAMDAEVLIIDAGDPAAQAWVRGSPWLAGKAVIWLDGRGVPSHHMALFRPVQWPRLPALLARALERAGRAGPQRPPAPAAPPSGSTMAQAVASGNTAGRAPGAGGQPAVGARPGPGAGQPEGAVLVASDNVLVRGHLRLVLQRRGCAVLEGVSAAQALELAASFDVGAVLLDAQMPGLDVYEACRQMRTVLRDAGAAPIVLLNSGNLLVDRLRAHHAGCSAHLVKPVKPDELWAVLGTRALPPGRRSPERADAAAVQG